MTVKEKSRKKEGKKKYYKRSSSLYFILVVLCYQVHVFLHQIAHDWPAITMYFMYDYIDSNEK